MEVRQWKTVQTAMPLPKSVVILIRDMSYREHQDLCLQNEIFSTIGAISVRKVMMLIDCRQFANFLLTYSLKLANKFLNFHPRYVEEAQLNSIHCCRHCRHYSVENHFISFQHAGVSGIFMKRAYALREAEKISDYIKRDKWPLEMYMVQDSLLQTANLDYYPNKNHENGWDNAPSLLESFERHFRSWADELRRV